MKIYYRIGDSLKVKMTMRLDGYVIHPFSTPFTVRLWTQSKSTAVVAGWNGKELFGGIAVDGDTIQIISDPPKKWWAGEIHGEAEIEYFDHESQNDTYYRVVNIEFEEYNAGAIVGHVDHVVYAMSAYDIALSHGYVGTEEEWVRSLKGDRGFSAYMVAVNNGYTGTEKEWVESLSAKVTADIDITHINDECPEGETPDLSVSVEHGEGSNRHLHFSAKYLRGERGFKGDKAVSRMTIREFNAYKESEDFDKERWYFVTSNTDAMRYIYAGDTLVAKSDKTGNIFPITFPMTFSS